MYLSRQHRKTQKPLKSVRTCSGIRTRDTDRQARKTTLIHGNRHYQH